MFESAYRTNYIELSIGSDTLNFSIIDVVGHDSLKMILPELVIDYVIKHEHYTKIFYRR
jgi:hypothetical protein